MRSHTSIPVSKVIAWSSDTSNPVGTEYIILEKASGRQLVDVWGEMNQLQQFQMIKELAHLEGQLASLEFPGYGNLYLRESLPPGVSEVIPVGEEYYLGPTYHASWFPILDNESHAGPCSSCPALHPQTPG